MKIYIKYLLYLSFTLTNTKLLAENKTNTDSLLYLVNQSNNYDTYANNLTNIILYYFHINPDSSIYYCKQGIVKAKEQKDTADLGFYYNVIGVCYKNLAQFDSAIFYLNQSVFFRKLENYKEGVAAEYNNLATVNRLKGNYTKAVKYYIKSIEIFKNVNDTINLAETYSNLGELYIELNEYKLAEHCFNESQKYYFKKNDFISLAWVYNDVALLKTKTGQVDSALIFYELSADLWKKEKRFLEYSNTLVSMSDLLFKKNKYKKAYQLLPIAEKYYTQFNNAHGLANVFLKQGKYFEHNHQYKKAIQKYKSALELSNSTKAKNLLAEVYKGLYRSNKEIGNTSTALIFLEHLTTLKDTIYNKEQNKIRLEYQIEFDALEKEKQIQELTQKSTIERLEILQSKQKIKENELIKEKQEIFIYSLIIVTFLIFLLTIVLYRRNQNKTKLNHQLENAVREREILLREIHHRVKNNLQIVSSLLNLQSTNITEKTASDVLKDSQDRIKSLSILHEKLYKSKSLNNINFKTYIKELIENLNLSFDLNKKNIQITQQIDNSNLHIDFLVPCGLIINELITNSLKYAFINNQSGKIDIKGKLINDTYHLIIKDNGIGLPKDFDPKQTTSLGLRLVQGLVRQIKGEIKFNNLHTGLEIIINFKVK